VLRSRQPGQSVVEFGIIAILFTLIMFAIADFGLLLNDWLSVSSGARLLARDVAVGGFTCSTTTQCSNAGVQRQILDEASKLSVPGVSADQVFTGFCCDVGNPGSALQVQVIYWDECSPQVNGCTPLSDPTKLDWRYTSGTMQGTCPSGPGLPVCLHPAAPAKQGTCGTPGPGYCPGDSITLTLVAAGAQVITPLVRPFFQNPVSCPPTSAHCYVALSSTVTMRFEGGAAP
jgi:hypothetical protein